MCGINYDTLSEEEIRRINDILSDHKLKVNDHKECFHFVKYTIELNYRSNIGALLSLRSNYAMALEDENIRVYREADHLIIEKKRDHGPLFYPSYERKDWWSNMQGAKILLGKDEDGKDLCTDVAKAPHILISGVPGSGKTTFLYTVINSLLYRANTYPIVMDGSGQRLKAIYRGVPSLYSHGSETDFRKLYDINLTLRRRIEDLNNKGLANISGTDYKPMFVIVNSMEELISQKPDAELLLANLLEFGDKAGIHMILCMENLETGAYTQRLRTSIPVRICFKMKNASQSLMVLGSEGAESLFGNGDMLFLGRNQNKPIRVQAALFSDSDLNRVASLIERANSKST